MDFGKNEAEEFEEYKETLSRSVLVAGPRCTFPTYVCVNPQPVAP